MAVLVTGAVGFIGFHVCRALLDRGERVVGIDEVNDYYEVALKQARLARLGGNRDFTFHKVDIADRVAMAGVVADHADIDRVVHLAAQAGVRYSLTNPFAYTHANLEGQVVLLEAVRKLPAMRHFVYASSSSVYGANRKLPFAVEDRVDNPVSLYAATKKAAELLSHAYSHLYRIPQTGLRFFTVYGPWGRPDMAAFIFTRKILKGEPIPVFNHGDMRRDFTYIDDIVEGILACLDRPPADGGADNPPYAIYNLGNHRSEPLMRFIGLIEQALGKKAVVELLPMQEGDVKETFADIADSTRDFGFKPRVPIDAGIPLFISWYREYYSV